MQNYALSATTRNLHTLCTLPKPRQQEPNAMRVTTNVLHIAYFGLAAVLQHRAHGAAAPRFKGVVRRNRQIAGDYDHQAAIQLSRGRQGSFA